MEINLACVCYLVFDLPQRVHKYTIIWQNVLTNTSESLGCLLLVSAWPFGRHRFKGATEGCEGSSRTLPNTLQTASHLKILHRRWSFQHELPLTAAFPKDKCRQLKSSNKPQTGKTLQTKRGQGEAKMPYGGIIARVTWTQICTTRKK